MQMGSWNHTHDLALDFKGQCYIKMGVGYSEGPICRVVIIYVALCPL